jgi:hypothetical protein
MKREANARRVTSSQSNEFICGLVTILLVPATLPGQLENEQAEVLTRSGQFAK